MESVLTSAEYVESRLPYGRTEAHSSGVSWGAVIGGAVVLFKGMPALVKQPYAIYAGHPQPFSAIQVNIIAVIVKKIGQV